MQSGQPTRVFDQMRFISNYNKLATALESAHASRYPDPSTRPPLPYPIQHLNARGVCYGLSNLYILSRHTNSQELFFHYIQFITQLDDEKIMDLVTAYLDNPDLQYERETFNPSDDSIHVIPFWKILNFCEQVSSIQSTQKLTKGTPGLDWDASFNYALNINNRREFQTFYDQLREDAKTYIENGISLFHVSLSIRNPTYPEEGHQIIIEIHNNELSIYDPNNETMPLTVLSLDDANAARILQLNLRHTMNSVGFDPQQSIQLFFNYLSHERSHTDQLTSREQFENFLQKESDLLQCHPEVTHIIHLYQARELSLLDTALQLQKICTNDIRLPKLPKQLYQLLPGYKIYNHTTLREHLKRLPDEQKIPWIKQAIQNNQISFMQTLLNEDILPKQQIDNDILLTFAVIEQKYDIVKLLLTTKQTTDLNPPYIDPSLLSYAYQNGDMEMFNLLIKYGATSLPDEPQAGLISSHVSPLLYAIQHRHHEVVSKLIQHGANPNELTDSGLPAIIDAVYSSDAKTVATLLEGGANPNSHYESSTGHKSVLHVAIEKNNSEMVKTLLKYGADARKSLVAISPRTAPEITEILKAATHELSGAKQRSRFGLFVKKEQAPPPASPPASPKTTRRRL